MKYWLCRYAVGSYRSYFINSYTSIFRNSLSPSSLLKQFTIIYFQSVLRLIHGGCIFAEAKIGLNSCLERHELCPIYIVGTAGCSTQTNANSQQIQMMINNKEQICFYNFTLLPEMHDVTREKKIYFNLNPITLPPFPPTPHTPHLQNTPPPPPSPGKEHTRATHCDGTGDTPHINSQ